MGHVDPQARKATTPTSPGYVLGKALVIFSSPAYGDIIWGFKRIRAAVQLVLVTACLVSLVLSASVGAAPGGPSLPGLPNPKVMAGEIGRFGGTFLDSQVSDPDTFNPLLADKTNSTGPLGNLFDGLVEDNGETEETEPALAESWAVSEDGRTWTFVLREGLQWNDGIPMSRSI